jgi:hypothetical protein
MKIVVVSPICDLIWSGATPVTLVSNILVPLGVLSVLTLLVALNCLADLFCCLFLILAPSLVCPLMLVLGTIQLCACTSDWYSPGFWPGWLWMTHYLLSLLVIENLIFSCLLPLIDLVCIWGCLLVSLFPSCAGSVLGFWIVAIKLWLIEPKFNIMGTGSK